MPKRPLKEQNKQLKIIVNLQFILFFSLVVPTSSSNTSNFAHFDILNISKIYLKLKKPGLCSFTDVLGKVLSFAYFAGSFILGRLSGGCAGL